MRGTNHVVHVQAVWKAGGLQATDGAGDQGFRQQPDLLLRMSARRGERKRHLRQ